MNKLISSLSSVLFVMSVAQADQVFQDDLVVQGSICGGLDCSNGENFGYDTIRLKENNLRIKFIDTSASSSFPTRDWQITANDSTNGGVNKFSIENIDGGTTPFSLIDGAPNNALYINSIGYIGLGTSTPGVKLDLKQGNSPTIRLSQDNTAGFSAQEWDMGGNESNFFVRDVTSGGALPFRIQTGAPNGSLYIASDGDIGFETTTPDGQFDVAHSANANNHAFLIDPNSNVGVNIDNGFVPNGLFEVQTTGGKSRFAVQSDGDVGVGTATPVGRFEVRDSGNTSSYLTVDATGNIGVGTSSPSTQLDIIDTTSAAAVTVASITAMKVENTSTTEAARILLSIENKGPMGVALVDNSANGDAWFIANDDGALVFFKDDLGTPLMRLKDNGDLEVKGSITGNVTF